MADGITKISLPSGTKLPQTPRFNQLWKRYQHTGEVDPGAHRVDIHEKLLRLKRLLQAIEQATGIARIISTTIVDEYLPGHVSVRPSNDGIVYLKTRQTKSLA
jgi:hypothetical protein